MAKKSTRIDFSYAVRRSIYERVDGKCSVPRCKNPTVGPFRRNLGSANLGTACHIYSASKDGPRGWGDKDEDFIGSEANGLWCCNYHGELIDKKQGSDYLVEELFAWKHLAEARVLKKMNDQPSPLGWVESIKLSSFSDIEVELSRNTILFGGEKSNEVSALLGMVASLSDSRYVDRFICPTNNKNDCTKFSNLEANVIYTTVDSLNIQMDIEITGSTVLRSQNRINYLLPPGDLEVIFSSDHMRNNFEDDIDYLMRILNVDKSTIYTLIEHGASALINGDMAVEHARLENDDGEEIGYRYKNNLEPYMELLFKLDHNKEFPKLKDTLDDKFLLYESLSSSEKQRLNIELLILKAREVCKQKLTLLVIENTAILDKNNFERLLRVLQQENFQSIVVVSYSSGQDILETFGNCEKIQRPDYLASWKLARI